MTDTVTRSRRSHPPRRFQNARPVALSAFTQKLTFSIPSRLQRREAGFDQFASDAAFPVLFGDRDMMQVTAAAVVPREAHADRHACIGLRYETRPGVAAKVACKRPRVVGIAKTDAGKPLPQRERRGYVILHHRANPDHCQTSEAGMSGPTCVIYNPAAGRGRAEKLLKELQESLHEEIAFRSTSRTGHAIELATRAAEEGFAKVVAAGGDGTVHEVANGLLQSDRHDVVFTVWPIGSANDYAYSLGMNEWWKKRTERLSTAVLEVDVGKVTVSGREEYFVCNLGVGFNGMINGEARKTHWLAGMPLYAWAFLKSMVKHFAKPIMTIRFDDREVTTPTLALSVLNGQREGNFPLRPAASLTDGLFDYMHATRLSRWHLIRYLPAMATGRLPENHRLLHLGRASRIEVRSEAPLCVHADGEFVCVPEDGECEVAIEVVPSRLRVEVFPPALYGGRK